MYTKECEEARRAHGTNIRGVEDGEWEVGIKSPWINPRKPLTLSEEKRKLGSLYELPRRLMARQQTLDLLIEVRILAGQRTSGLIV